LDPQLLEIELTESYLVQNDDRTHSILKRIKEMGIRVTMDDFGTGYSSLSCLSKIPLSCVKIDRSFIVDINNNEDVGQLIASIISMAHKLGLDVVAEGVEEKQQVDRLIAFGCNYLQGYYFSRPVSRDMAEGMLRKQPMALVG
jgi:EAL domain-containing protein (putative c-di-GMP-specific phosphodiesterase class I)